MDNQNNEKEIDLVSILAVCGRKLKALFKNFGRALSWSLRFAYKNKAYMLGAFVCAILFAAFWGRPSNRKFQMETELRVNVLDSYFFNDMVTSINHMCDNSDVAGLSKSLNVAPDVAKTLCSVNSFFIVDKLCDGTPDEVCYDEYKADTTKQIMKDRLLIRIVISDTTLVDSISKGLIYFFSSNPYVMENNKERLSQIEEGIGSINNEMLMLDSLRKYEYFKSKVREMQLEGPLIVSEKNKQLYYNDILSLEKSRNEKAFERAVMSTSVMWARDFVMTKVYNKYFKSFILSFIFFGIIALLLGFVTGEKAQIKEFLSK